MPYCGKYSAAHLPQAAEREAKTWPMQKTTCGSQWIAEIVFFMVRKEPIKNNPERDQTGILTASIPHFETKKEPLCSFEPFFYP